MADQPLVTVVVPARNEEAFVEAALESVAGQTLPASGIEVVVVVNGTSDRTADVARATAGRLVGPTIRVVEDPLPGVARAKNHGARLARGAVLVFLDADSRLAPDLLERIVARTKDGAPAGSVRLVADSTALIDRGFFATIEYGKRLFSIRANMLYCRRDAFLAVGGFNERFHHAEDRDLLVRLQRQGVVVAHLTESWIATSPRRLHEGPLGLGLARVLGRWAIGHAGFWRERPY